jgi:hypothetical protein
MPTIRANLATQEAADLRSLLVRYIQHVQGCEGVDYIVSGSHHADDAFTDDEWRLLETLSAEASAADQGEPKETK